MFRTIDLAIPLSAALALITLTLVPSRADPTSAPDKSVTGVFGEGAPTQGQPSKTGAMKWTYPFELPSARGRPQPRLSLSYDSSSHDREAGYGWGFELPVIELKPLSGNPCFESDGTPLACWKKNFPHSLEYNNEAERYAFNGEPLVFICQLPAPPENCDPNHASEPQPDWIAHGTWRYFRLQVEGEFSRFYLSEDRRYWRVQLKGGELLEFGEPPLSTGSGVEHPADNQSAVLRWRLVRELDLLIRVRKISSTLSVTNGRRWANADCYTLRTYSIHLAPITTRRFRFRTPYTTRLAVSVFPANLICRPLPGDARFKT